jgi:hypothetical protein
LCRRVPRACDTRAGRLGPVTRRTPFRYDG